MKDTNMAGSRFDGLTRRRFGLGAACVAVTSIFDLGQTELVEDKRLCRKNGGKCKKKGGKCKAQFCLAAPFTIEARWSNAASDHDTFLFVPNEEGNDDPFPHISVTRRTCRADGGND